VREYIKVAEFISLQDEKLLDLKSQAVEEVLLDDRL
jgi:hypothetical protein